MSLILLGKDKAFPNTANSTSGHICINPPPSTKGYKDIQDMLGQQRRIDHIKGDGNCLFRAISKELLGHEKFHHLVRHFLVHFISANGKQFQEYLSEGKIEAHLQRMRNLGQWGTSVEIFGLATLLKTKVYIFSKQSNCQQYKWLCYHPLQQRSRLTFDTEVIHSLSELLPPEHYHLELIHSFQNHFDRVSPTDLLLTSMNYTPPLDSAPSNSSKNPIEI